MGLLTDRGSTLISLNLGGLEKTLEQMLEALQKQDATQKKQEEALQAHSERLDAIEVGGNVADYAALEGSVGELSRRLTLSEQSQAQQQGRADLEKRLHEERCSREALEEVVRSLEASSEELRRRCQAFEARVSLAEEKASECRREAKAYRDTVEEREFSASQVQQTLRMIESSTKHTIENSGQVEGLQREASMLSRSFESQFRELETRLEAKVNESVVDAMRSDLEMNEKVLQDAVKAVGQRLSEQEERLRGLESSGLRNDSAERLRHRVQDSRDQSWRDGAREREDCSRCLLCANDRSLSPTRVVIGSDNLVYGHADSLPEYAGEHRASQPIVRPRPTPPSIPQGPPQVVLSSSWEALPGRALGTAASTSSIQKGAVRLCGRDVRSKRIGDLVNYQKVEPDSKVSSRPSSATSMRTQTPWPSTRPSSAYSQGERGRRGPRPSSAGTYRTAPPLDTLSTSSPSAGDLMLVASQSLPMIEKRSDSVEAL